MIGKPLAMLLLERNATVTLAHSRTAELEKLTREADIVVACVGRALMIGKPHVSTGQVLIDVGINVIENGALVGDVAFDEVVDVVEAVTPCRVASAPSRRVCCVSTWYKPPSACWCSIPL